VKDGGVGSLWLETKRDNFGGGLGGKRGVRDCPDTPSNAGSVTPVAGLIFETKNRAIFLERFFWRDFSGAALLPENFVPIK